MRTITVKGTGNVSARPDYIILSLNIEVLSETYDRAMSEAAERIERLQGAAVRVGYRKKDLKTTNFDVQTRYENVKDRQGNYKREFAGYDRKFRNFWGSTKAVRQLSDTICVENGLSIVENPKPHGKSYNKWLGDQAKPSHRELLRVAIDNALSQSPTDFEALLKLLQESGCEVSKRGKSYRLKLPGWEKAARMDSLGEGYGLDDLQAVLSGKKAHTPRKKVVAQAEPPKVNLLVDIQAKLQAGKGAGYARWAKVFNLKQMAQTMNYLSENNLLEYAILEEKAAAATAHHNELSAQIKAAEKRMAEIAVLRTHIVNYAKTREVYVAYRKAGYSKKFREEHEEEILLHQAAKNAFDEMGVKKLPKVKELQTGYAKLLEEKKKTYAEYRRSREEMRELLTAKANVDRVLKMEVEQDVEKEKDHGQR